MANKKYIVADKGYVRKKGKIYQTGQEVELTDKEYENVKGYVVDRTSKEGKILVAEREEVEEQKKEAEDQSPEQEDKK